MICGIFHEGSGLGNQLHRYVATRVLALDKGVGYSMKNFSLFKGEHFIKNVRSIAWSEGEKWPTKEWLEKKVVENGVDIRSYDPEFNFIEDGTVIDGEFQDERYFGHRMKEIDEWLKVEPLNIPDDVCVIGFRGGEFSVFPDLFLTKEYWEEAKVLMLRKNINMKFEVHTDDEILAKQFFPDYKIIHDIGINWRSIRFAKYAIIANSSFYILPRLLNSGYTIAPHFWARRNTGIWCLPQNYYKQFTYI